MKILLLEDDVALSEVITEYLQDSGYDVEAVYDGQEALNQSYESNYDLYIFDVNVPMIKGFDLLKLLRNRNDNTPAIFITALNNIEDVSLGFDSGCDDYLKKPFELAELLLRIKNIQKRAFVQPRSSTIKIFDDIVFDIEKELLIKEGSEIQLPNKELKALKYFLQHSSEVIPYEELFEVMWDFDEEPSMKSLRVHMRNLRHVLRQDLIKNIRGVGYRFDLGSEDESRD